MAQAQAPSAGLAEASFAELATRVVVPVAASAPAPAAAAEQALPVPGLDTLSSLDEPRTVVFLLAGFIGMAVLIRLRQRHE